MKSSPLRMANLLSPFRTHYVTFIVYVAYYFCYRQQTGSQFYTTGASPSSVSAAQPLGFFPAAAAALPGATSSLQAANTAAASPFG